MGGAGTDHLVREGDAKHGGGEAVDAGAVVGEEGFVEVAFFGGLMDPSDLICWLGMESPSEALQVVIWDIMSHFRPFLDQLIGHYSSLWGIMPEFHVECPISSFLYVDGT